MKNIFFTLLCLFTQNTFAASENTLSLTQPIFLKMGFSSVLEFNEEPQKIVLGDSQSFQVEKLGKSLVLRPLVPYASSNLFVYFKNLSTQIFSLTASEDAHPTLLKKIEPLELPKKDYVTNSVEAKKIPSLKKKYTEKLTLTRSHFNKAKDYLLIDFKISSGQDNLLQPKWDLIRLGCKDKQISAYKIWSQRKEIQKDSEVKSRITFLRPNVGIELKNCKLLVPLKGRSDILKLGIK